MLLSNKIKKYVSTLLVVSIFTLPIFSVLPKEVKAFPVEEVGPVAALAATTATATASIAAATGIVGSGDALIAGLRTGGGEACQVILEALSTAELIDVALNLGTEVGFNLVGGDLFESAFITKQIAQLTTAKACVDPYVLALQHTPGLTYITGQSLQRETEVFTKAQADINQRLEDLEARSSASVKEILKAVLTNIILNLNKTLTTKIVNGLLDKYKISDYAEYANVVGTQLYAMDYIAKNLPADQQQQAIVRSLIQERQFPGQGNLNIAEQMIHQKAQEFLGYDFSTLSPSDPDFYAKLTRAGSTQADDGVHGGFLLYKAGDQAAAATQAGLSTASQEISQSSGFIPTRKCGGSVNEQQAADVEYKRLAEQVKFDTEVLNGLIAAKAAETEITQARSAVAASGKALLAAPQAVGKTIVKICQAIDSPADFIAQGLNGFLKTHLENATDLKSDNLPFFGRFLSDIASNFVTNIITGGYSDAKQVNESGLSAIGLGSADIDTSTNFDSAVPPTFPSVNSNGNGNNNGGGGGNGGGGDNGNGNGNNNGNNNGNQTNPDIQISYQPNPAIANQDFDLFINYPAETTLYKPRNLVFYSNDSTTSDQNLLLEDTDPNPINLHSAAPSETTKLTIEVLATNKQTGIVESLGKNSVTIVVSGGGGSGTVQGAFIRKPGTQIGAKYSPRGTAIKPR